MTQILEKESVSAPLGWWESKGRVPKSGAKAIGEALGRIGEPFFLLRVEGGYGVGEGGVARLHGGEAGGAERAPRDSYPIVAYVPPCLPEHLGDRTFCADHRLKYPYVAGAMANGVGSVEIVEAMARAGMIGFFGAAGLPLDRVETAIDRIQSDLGAGEDHPPYGFNLIHSPGEPALEEGAVDLYLRRGIRLVSASAYLRLTLPVVRYRVAGIHRNAAGEIVAPNRIVAKVSRVEVARRFFSPPPEKLLRAVVERGEITESQALLAESIPMAQDLTAEADSGGHTDNQPFLALLPTMLALRDEMQAAHGYECKLRVGAAGGIGTPASAAAAFSMGAAYILTGSINQSCREAGTSALVREMLRQTRQADVAMAPAADMFEMGVKVQVLKRGTMFAMRARKLYEIYRANESFEHIPAEQRARIETDFFCASFDEVWSRTQQFFAERDPKQVERAERDPKHKMALVFRWYLGMSSMWANAGEERRKVDFQIWCGPAMGAFNEWVKGTALEPEAERRVDVVGWNLLLGAATLLRLQNLRSQGVELPAELSRFEPLTGEKLKQRLNSRGP